MAYLELGISHFTFFKMLNMLKQQIKQAETFIYQSKRYITQNGTVHKAQPEKRLKPNAVEYIKS